MPHTFEPLPSLYDPSLHISKKLTDLRPFFSIPPLEDRPQNPIVEALSQVPRLPNLHLIVPSTTDEAVSIQEKNEQDDEDAEEGAFKIWTDQQVIANTRPLKNQNLSWDALRKTFPKQPTSTPFLSEQSNNDFDAIRHHVRPRLNDPTLQLHYILPAELLDHLLINLVGDSSPLYIWDAKDECFVPCTGNGARLLVLVEGLDDRASASIIKRFVHIGSLMRRLEILLVALRQQNSNPTTHGFAYALSTIIAHLRNSLACKPPYPATHLTSIWLYYADSENILTSLASLCRRDHSPPYDPLPDSPAGLLSHIYDCLDRHIGHGASHDVIAILAYILTITSRNYFVHLEESLGLFDESQPPWLRSDFLKNQRTHRTPDILDDIELTEESVIPLSDDVDERDLPSFIPVELAKALPTARKSLRILQIADPNNHLPSASSTKKCEWLWSSEEINNLWENRDQQNPPPPVTPQNVPEVFEVLNTTYEPELKDFGLFDLEPGSHLSETRPSTEALSVFLSSFPDRLPPIAPKLEHLATIVLQPLIKRTKVLSSSLLKVYLTSLHLETHLVLLRSYLLITLPAFKARLVGALFSDSDELKPMGHSLRVRTQARVDDTSETNKPMTEQVGHGIGLGPTLADRGTWPPGGADLGFFLRNVIVDSLAENTGETNLEDERDETAEAVWREGEVRLGFALRDLPFGDGREKWLNPMSIEALDFLYLDYKPPHPLDVVITSDILTKYQRTFTFLLRIFRAEAVTRIAYGDTFKWSSKVFSYAPKAQTTLLLLRFQIQTFVTSFVTYIFDSVIGGSFDSFMRHISELHSAVVEGGPDLHENAMHEITNVFALRDSHSRLLDRILSGCLLRTSQRVAGDALRELLELVLEFGALISNSRRGVLREADAVKEVSELFELYQKQMLRFVKALLAMQTKDKNSQLPDHPPHIYLQGSGPQSEQHSYLDDLLTRIDPTRWWRKKLEKQVKGLV